MAVDFISKNNGNELGDSCKDEICMECFLILGSAPGEAEMLFDVINPSLNNSSDFVCIIPFFGATDCSRISTEIFFGINIDHTATS